MTDDQFHPEALIGGVVSAVSLKALSKGVLVSTFTREEMRVCVKADLSSLQSAALAMANAAVEACDGGTLVFAFAVTPINMTKSLLELKLTLRSQGTIAPIPDDWDESVRSALKRIDGVIEIGKGADRTTLSLTLPCFVVLTRHGEPLRSSSPLDGLRVLLAEDNALNARIVTKLLESRGCVITWVHDGQQCVEAANAKKYDVILMDVAMPVLDGIQATRQIVGGSRPWQRPAIVAITAHALEEDRERCLGAGMDHYMTKPLRIDGLYKLLEQIAIEREPGTESEQAA